MNKTAFWSALRVRFVRFCRLSTVATLGTFFFIYLMASPALFPEAYDRMLFPGWHCAEGNWQLSNLCGIPREDVTFKTADTKDLLRGWLFTVPKAKGTVLIHHGNGRNITNYNCYTEYFVYRGYSVLIYDYRGYGLNPGKPTLAGIVKDGMAAYDFLVKTKHIDPKNIFHCGISLGTGVACNVAATRPCNKVILLSPYASILETGKGHLAWLNWYPSFLVEPYGDLKCTDFVKAPHCPVLVMHGAKDRTVPISQAEKVVAAGNGTVAYRRWDNAGHGDFLWVDTARADQQLMSFMNGESVATKSMN